MVLPNDESRMNNAETSTFEWQPKRSPVNTNASPLPTAAALPGTCSPFAAACLLKDGLRGRGGGGLCQQNSGEAEICQRGRF